MFFCLPFFQFEFFLILLCIVLDKESIIQKTQHLRNKKSISGEASRTQKHWGHHNDQEQIDRMQTKKNPKQQESVGVIEKPFSAFQQNNFFGLG